MSSVFMCVGMPRSGTTWIAKIIDSHPDILYNHEPDSVSPLNNTPIFCTDNTHQEQHQVKCLIKQLPLVHEKCLGKRPFFKKSYRNFYSEMCFRASILATKALQKSFILKPVSATNIASAHLMFKSIESTGRIELFLSSIPTLKVLLIVRSVYGQINSVIKGSSGSEFLDNNYNLTDEELTRLYQIHDYRNSMTLDQVLALSVIEQLAYKWLVTNEKAIEEAKAASGRVKIISYDELCEQPMSGAQEIFSFFNIPFHQQTEQFIKESTSSHDEAFYSVNKDPKQAKFGWQKNITDEQVIAINRIINNSQAAQYSNGLY